MRGTRRAICARCVRVFGFGFAFSVQRWLRVAFALVHWLTAAVRSPQMTFLLNHRPVDALALIVHSSGVEETGRHWVEKLCKC